TLEFLQDQFGSHWPLWTSVPFLGILPFEQQILCSLKVYKINIQKNQLGILQNNTSLIWVLVCLELHDIRKPHNPRFLNMQVWEFSHAIFHKVFWKPSSLVQDLGPLQQFLRHSPRN